MCHSKGVFFVTGKDIEARKFDSRRAAKDWCRSLPWFSNKRGRAGCRKAAAKT
jgi:hypothetical protein